MFLLASCKSGTSVKSEDFLALGGETMGTFYECKFDSPTPASTLKNEIDSLLKVVNLAASTYIPNAAISEFNQASSNYCLDGEDIRIDHFNTLFEQSKIVHENSSGMFDPTVMPLVNFWGFGYKDRVVRSESDSVTIQELLKSIGMNKISAERKGSDYCYNKKSKSTELDFSAIAKGYAVDLIALLLERNGSNNYMINIGGEIKVKGKNDKGKKWTLGINYPDTSSLPNDIYARLNIKEGAIASSGNYRNYYSSPKGAIVHTINPRTGMAIPSDMLGATIVMNSCSMADAYATACMAMGFEQARTLVEENSDIEAMLIYLSNDRLMHYISDGLTNNIIVE
jgi:thiamine biosynthesis lipoprotein